MLFRSVNAAASSVTFAINGTTAGTVTANIPSGGSRLAGYGQGIYKSAGTTPGTVKIDYTNFEQTFTTAR